MAQHEAALQSKNNCSTIIAVLLWAVQDREPIIPTTTATGRASRLFRRVKGIILLYNATKGRH